MHPDWTIVFDDVMTTRFTVCMFCVQPADRLEMWAAENGWAMALAVCRRCADADASKARRNARVEDHARRQEQAGERRW